MSSLTLEKIHKAYDNGTQVIHGIDLDISHGEFVVFVGPSGCGKSTMLRMIAGLEDISSGNLFFGNKRVNDLEPAARCVGMVFQSYALYPHLTVRENIGFSLKLSGHEEGHIQSEVERISESLQIQHLLERKPKALSGGQRQRVAIGRAIAKSPEVFLFDEPLSNLDASLRVQMRLELSRLHRELGATMVYVTHDQVEAMTMADRIVVFNKGRIEQIGTPLELYSQPANTFVATFIGSPSINLLDAILIDGNDGHFCTASMVNGSKLQTHGLPLKRGTPVQIGIRPENVHLDYTDGSSSIESTIVAIERLGDVDLIYCSLAKGAGSIVVKTPSRTSGMARGQVLNLYVHPDNILTFNAEGKLMQKNE
jgi:multiple sugar transport system ATP-binding protein